MKSDRKFKNLIENAMAVQQLSQAKYSNFKVGAAIETDEGEVYSGCNVESSSYGLTICAERVALTKALSEGKTNFSSIAIVGPHDDYCPPCGACRQLLYEYAPNIQIILTNNTDTRVFDISELLPYAFEEKNLRKR